MSANRIHSTPSPLGAERREQTRAHAVEPVRALETWNASEGRLAIEFHRG